MGEKIIMICAGLVAAFAIPYIITSIFQTGNYQEKVDIKGLKSGRSVCIYSQGEYELIDVEEYVVYTLAGQADLSWEDEMLKTMAVIIRTSIYYQMNENADTYTDSGARLINEDQLIEIRYEDEDLRQMWGSGYEANLYRIYQAVAETEGQVITYSSACIVPMYHRISVGNTASASEIYGIDLPYLQSVESSMDIEADNFSVSAMYSEIRIKKIFSDKGYQAFDTDSGENQNEGKQQDVPEQSGGNTETAEADIDPAALKVIEATTSGFAKKVNVFGTVMSGEEFAGVMDLPSTNFHIDLVDGNFRIITIGEGSCVGLSLYGANALAKKGEDYITILKYYYTGVEIGN